VKTIVDTGPLVAVLRKREKNHAWTREVFSRLRPPLYTCEAVITEATFLLGLNEKALVALRSMLQGEVLRIDFSAHTEHAAVFKLMSRYASVPMSFADACLVRMSELAKPSQVITFDSDFRVYRRNGREVVPTLMP